MIVRLPPEDVFRISLFFDDNGKAIANKSFFGLVRGNWSRMSFESEESSELECIIGAAESNGIVNAIIQFSPRREAQPRRWP